MGADRGAELGAVEGARYCARHPQVETELECGRCGTLICPRCLVQTPVGARCPTCAQVRRLPTADVGLAYLARGVAAGVGGGALVGAAWGYAVKGQGVGFFGFFILFIAFAIGWAIGEIVSVATNRKRAIALQACAVVGVVLAYLVHNVVAGNSVLPPGDIWGYLATALAAAVAMDRVRP